MNFVNSPLFYDVQQSAIFADSKTFADAIANDDWQVVCARYQQLGPLKGNALKQFVEQHFSFASTALTVENINTQSVQDYIKALWPQLYRDPDQPSSSSLLPLKYSYIVPGGRFQEIYYWDSYFTALGLEDIGDMATIEAMLQNFIDLQTRNGCIPNGNRSYYSSRSQPPVLALIVDLVWRAKYQAQGDLNWLADCVTALQQEYQFWMQGSDQLSEQTLTHKRVVNVAEGALLNRYWDDETTPRPESLREDLHDVAALNEQLQREYFRNIRAACESGWDFSSRWLSDNNDLTSIETTNIVPVDLNCLLFNLEQQLAHYYQVLGQSQQSALFSERANKRLAALSNVCWNETLGLFMDYNLRTKQQTNVCSLASTVPLFVNLATPQQAAKTKTVLINKFLKQGGLVTTLNTTAQQWDSPNGWAPLQWFAVQGLKHYGYDHEAETIMTHWLTMLESCFATDSCLLEKYNVCEPTNRAGGGEYTVQQGFGWTNGVTSRFYQLLQK
ncbi:trehalase family glycosidase [Pseudoalteromonas mariniglutinosa]|uniref:trehalase family glycosidase n=1 Tax=Pseudoalteromonas mariniglutinosa TaxID=206042 RepID=UPI00384C43BE